DAAREQRQGDREDEQESEEGDRAGHDTCPPENASFDMLRTNGFSFISSRSCTEPCTFFAPLFVGAELVEARSRTFALISASRSTARMTDGPPQYSSEGSSRSYSTPSRLRSAG